MLENILCIIKGVLYILFIVLLIVIGLEFVCFMTDWNPSSEGKRLIVCLLFWLLYAIGKGC